MTSALSTIEELGELPPPPPARPRVLVVATALVSAATAMAFAAMLGVYLHERSAVVGTGGDWGLDIPLTPGNMSLVGFALSIVTIHWAVDAIGSDDRRHTWLALGATMLVGAMHFVGMAFLFSQTGLEVASFQGGLFYAILGAHLAMVGLAMLYIALMAFRTLGGQYSAKDREGIVAAAVFWDATAVVYLGIWYAILVVK